MTSARTLTSLPSDVLREILSHVLLDTPQTPLRTSVLRTCSLLYELGLPHFYRIVDLTGFRTKEILLERWRVLFGEGGLFTEEGGKRGAELRKMVKELRVGGEPVPSRSDWDDADEEEDEAEADVAIRWTVQKVSLPSCSRLVVDLWYIEGSLQTVIGPLISQLPVEHLQLQYRIPDPFTPSKELNYLAFPSRSSLPSRLFGHSSIQPWTTLRTVVFQQCLWTEDVDGPNAGEDLCPRRLSSSQWSFKVLVFEVTTSPSHIKNDAWAFINALCPNAESRDRFLVDTERIELETSGPDAREFEEELRKRVATWTTLDALHRRIYDSVVLVGEDGKERRLMEGL